jgi:hypothetical protein
VNLVDLADTGAFLARLTRLDPAALVRLRPMAADAAGTPRIGLWARLPWDVLVTRTIRGELVGDATVGAADLLARVEASGSGGVDPPARRDRDWRWPVPPDAGRAVETVAAAELRAVATAAAGTLREAAASGVDGRSVGERAVRDALLDHVAIVVTHGGGERVEVTQRLVQAVARMGFLGPPRVSGSDAEGVAQIRLAGRWVGIAAPYGTAWSRSSGQLAIRPVVHPPNG